MLEMMRAIETRVSLVGPNEIEIFQEIGEESENSVVLNYEQVERLLVYLRFVMRDGIFSEKAA